MTDTNQASEDELAEILFEAIEAAATYTHNVTAEEADYIQNKSKQAIQNLIRNEKLKLLAEVRERVVGEKTSPNFDNEYGYCINCEFQPTDGTKHCLCYYDEKLRKKQRKALTAIEGELL